MQHPQQLPFIDTHTVHVRVSPDVVYEALWRSLQHSFGGRAARVYGRLVTCQPATGNHTPQPEPGMSRFIGFEVIAAEVPMRLHLAGAHHFSTYRIEFELSPTASGTTLAATTLAAFHGVRGRLYRAMVIGSRGHVLATRGMLRAVARRASSS